MKKVLLSLLLTGSVSFLFAQTNPNFPCPIDVRSNQGGGSCAGCVGSPTPPGPNQPGFDFSVGATAVVTLNFTGTGVDCIPRLRTIRDQDGNQREIRCGLGNRKSDNPNNPNFNFVEYCIFGTPNDNFFNQPDLIVELQYINCPGGTPTGTVFCNSNGIQVPGLIPLPITLKSFSASRNRGNVTVRFTTSTETNNRGFYVQRNTGGRWENVSYIASQATGGNSSSDLSYSFTDANDHRGISQYRIQQLDFDGKSKLSEIRSVRGEGQLSKTLVYPNPSNEGGVNVVFDDATGTRDVIVSDISGRVVKSWKGIKENNLRITNLMPGTYMLRIVNETGGNTVHEKIVVNR
jgi:hypothetical protein